MVRLDALGFIWAPRAAQWEEGFEHLQAFVKAHGHCRVSTDYSSSDEYRLGHWVKMQRREEDSLPSERKARLDSLGFIWDAITAQWEEGFEHLQTFVKEHGHCRVPALYASADGFRLGIWVRNRRRQEDSLPSERKARLNALGFIWSGIL